MTAVFRGLVDDIEEVTTDNLATDSLALTLV
jgi:hypothetical protein